MTKNKFNFSFGLIVALTGFSISAFAADAPQFTCVDKSVAIYSPGPRWSELEQALDQHLVFISTQLKNKILHSAGPMISQEGEPSGGLTIYNVTDLQQVRAIVEQDPLIRDQISTYELRTWRKCDLKDGE